LYKYAKPRFKLIEFTLKEIILNVYQYKMQYYNRKHANQIFDVFQELQEDSRGESSAFGEAEETAFAGLIWT